MTTTAEKIMLCAKHHTPCPEGYIEWHEWAKKKGKTHMQTPCLGCGLLKVWIPKKDAYKRGKP